MITVFMCVKDASHERLILYVKLRRKKHLPKIPNI